jgi:hypothetical protein
MSDLLVEIPANLRPVLDNYYHRKRSERFGPAALSPEQELAFIQELLEASESVVPLPDGSEAVITGGPEWDDHERGTPPRVSTPSGRKNGNALAFGAVMIAAIGLMFGGDIAGWAGSITQGNDGQVEGEDGVLSGSALRPDPVYTPMALPSGLDDIVTAMGVRVPLVVPRTLEISAAITSTTFPILPVAVAVADWPCPQQDQPVACWVHGTVVNYLVGLPSNAATEALMGELKAGDELRMRLSTEHSLSFTTEWVRNIPRQQVEVLRQNRFGLTLALLHGAGDSRRVAWARYGAGEDMTGAEAATTAASVSTPLETGSVAPGPADGNTVVVQLGTAVSLPGGRGRATPVAMGVANGQSRLRLLVENTGATALDTSLWRARLLTATEAVGGTIEASQIAPGELDTVVCSAPGDARRWEVTAGETVFVVE